MAQGQHAGIAVTAELFAWSIASVQGATHKGAVRQDGTLRCACSATSEEDGGCLVLIDRGDRSGMIGAIRDGDDLAGRFFDGFHEVFSSCQHLHAKLHAAAHNGLCRQLRW